MAPSIVERLASFSSWLAADKMPSPIEIRSETSSRIVRDQGYFGVTLNELNLARGREWSTEYDPLVYASVDFLYGTERVAIPKLIGPSSLKAMLPEGQELPHGFLFRDIRVAGPVPYRGGQVGITVLLFKVRTTDYALRVLRVAESLSEAIGVAEIGRVARIGASVVESLQALFSMREAEPVLGQHIELNASVLGGLPRRSAALLRAGDSLKASLSISEDRLVDGSGEEFSAADFVLYTVWGAEARETDRTLPLYSQLQKMYEAAAAGDETSWARAKSILISIYQEMKSSPDLTVADADRFFESYKAELLKRHEIFKKISIMGPGRGAARSEPYRDDIEMAALNRRTEDVLAM